MEPIKIDQDRCIGCQACVDVCVRGIYEMADAGIIAMDPSRCLLCGHCVAVCPEDAIELPIVNMKEFEPTPERKTMPTPEQLMGLFRSRRSVRKYRQRLVEQEKIQMIIEAARFAPTGGNLQPFRFSVVQHPEALQSIKEMAMEMLVRHSEQTDQMIEEKIRRGEALSHAERIQQNYVVTMRNMASALHSGVDRLLGGAPVLISVYTPSDLAESGVNAGLAGMQMSLMAEALGLGSCFIGFVVRAINGVPQIRKVMNIPEDSVVMISMIAGYPDVHYLKVVSRKPARISWV